ncbi:Helitron helicase-like protein, partial [Phytophthora palmivora]
MFAQVCINDPDMEARVASRMGMTDELDPAILEKSTRILIDRAGPAYQAAVEQFARQLVAGEARPGDNPALRLNEFLPRDEDLRLRLHVARNANPGTHNVPTASEVAAIIIDRAAAEHRDIILNTRQGGIKRIFETSESYDPLQYPLLFPYGEPGWTYDLPYVGDPVYSNVKPLTMSLREYESYVLHDRTASNSLILRGGRLTQQYCVDQWAKYSTEPEAENIGRKVIIPPTFTGGSRYMYQRFLDAMAIVRETGAPNLFITMTCNPNWPEIKENLRPGEKASDRPDIVA